MKSLSREQKDQLIANLAIRSKQDAFFVWHDASWLCMDFVQIPDEVEVEVMQLPVWPLSSDNNVILSSLARKMRYRPWIVKANQAFEYVNLDGDTVSDCITVEMAKGWGEEITKELISDVKTLAADHRLVWGPHIMPHVQMSPLGPDFSAHKVVLYRYGKARVPK